MKSLVFSILILLGLISGIAYSDPTQNPLINHQTPPVVTPVPSTPDTINMGNTTGPLSGNGVNTNGTANSPEADKELETGVNTR